MYARWAPGSRVTQEYYTALPVPDTNWILETIGGSVPQRGEDYKPDKSGDSKEGKPEIAEANTKDRTEKLPKSGIEEGKKPTRKRLKRRESLLKDGGKKSETVQPRCSTPRQPSRQKTPP